MDTIKGRLIAVSWPSLVPLVLWAVTLVTLPGMAAARAIGARGALSSALWAPFSVGLIGVSTVVLGWLHVPWNIFTAALVWGAIVVGAYGLRRGIERWVGPLPRFGGGAGRWPALVIGATVATVGFAASAAALFPDASLFAQTFDNVFHLNAIRYVLDTQNASPWWINTLTSGQHAAFYPSAWHAYVSLVLQPAAFFTPTLTIPIAVNAATMAILVAGWAPGVLTLTQLIAGDSPAPSVLMAGITGSIYVFPWLFIPWGSLYPNLLGFAVMPGAMVPLLLAAGFPRQVVADRQVRRAGSTLWRPSAPAWLSGRITSERPSRILESARVRDTSYVVAFVCALPGAGLAHPNVALGLVFIGIVVGWGRWLTVLRLAGPRSTRPLTLALSGVSLLAASAIFSWAWVRFAPTSAATPLPTDVFSETMDLLLGATQKTPMTLAIPIFVVLGLIVAVTRREWSLIFLTVVPTLAIVLVASASVPGLSNTLGAVFYNDPHRIAAYAFICALPIMALGAWLVVQAIRQATIRLGGTWLRDGAVLAVTGIVTAAIAVPTWTNATLPQLGIDNGLFVTPSPTSRYVSADEYQLMLRLRAELPRDAKVIGDPGNGSGFIYAISGVPVVFPHLLVTDTAAMTQVRNHLFDKTEIPKNCAALAELGAYYYADFGHGHYSFSGPDYYPGLSPVKRWMMALVDQQGDARIYRITICDQPR